MHTNDSPSDHPDFGAMRKALEELTAGTVDEGLDCPKPSCEGTVRIHDGLLACERCRLGRANGQ